jgi:hypothetical protein
VRFLTLLLLLCPIVTIAGPPSIVITDSGYFTLTVGADGAPVTERITSVVDMRGNPQSTPTPPKPEPPIVPHTPAPSPDEELSGKAARWAGEENDATGAGEIAIIYTQVGEAVQRGEVTPDAAAGVTRAAAEKMVSGWGTFRNRVGSEAAERIATAGPMGAAEMSNFLFAISAGIKRKSSPVPLERAVSITESVNDAIGGK